MKKHVMHLKKTVVYISQVIVKTEDGASTADAYRKGLKEIGPQTKWEKICTNFEPHDTFGAVS